MNTIFVQIASYRDPQLPHTLRDCLNKAKYPNNLKFCIAHQYDDAEDLSEFENDKRFIFIKIPYQESKGACWARNLIQQQYSGEKYTLQLDSHHRFIDNWDIECISLIKGLTRRGIKKPLLTGYIPSFDPDNDPAGRAKEPWKMDFDRFTPEGVVFFMPSGINNYKEIREPIPARFYSAHFCFTLGSFAVEVQHDPEYYFHGEEISIAVRAYTHGYDLFHPHKIIAWHEYTRRGRAKHWDDNKEWSGMNVKCHLRNKKLFEMDGEKRDIDFGIYGFGVERTLEDYERYAGISFKKRAIQQYTLDKNLAPNPPVEDFDKSLLRIFKHCIDIRYDQVPESDYDFWCVAFHGENEETIYRRDADKEEIDRMFKDPDKYCKVWREFNCEQKPKYWVVWPHSESKGWCEKILMNI
jgi:hypothetical protein